MTVIWKFNGITIFVKCPKCGKIGRLVSKGRTRLKDEPKLMIRHGRGACNIGKCSEYYEELAEIYSKCREQREKRAESRKRRLNAITQHL